eukprot:3634149-Pyramimonas_sp.AAC.1
MSDESVDSVNAALVKGKAAATPTKRDVDAATSAEFRKPIADFSKLSPLEVSKRRDSWSTELADLPSEFAGPKGYTTKIQKL